MTYVGGIWISERGGSTCKEYRLEISTKVRYIPRVYLLHTTYIYTGYLKKNEEKTMRSQPIFKESYYFEY